MGLLGLVDLWIFPFISRVLSSKSWSPLSLTDSKRLIIFKDNIVLFELELFLLGLFFFTFIVWRCWCRGSPYHHSGRLRILSDDLKYQSSDEDNSPHSTHKVIINNSCMSIVHCDCHLLSHYGWWQRIVFLLLSIPVFTTWRPCSHTATDLGCCTALPACHLVGAWRLHTSPWHLARETDYKRLDGVICK